MLLEQKYPLLSLLFTGVCLSRGGGACPLRVPALGGGACSGGCLLWGGYLLQWGGPAPGGVPGGDPSDGYCCGRYASYWNAFLLIDKFCF